MKYNKMITKSFAAMLLAGAMLNLSCSKDEYAEINTDPAKIGTPDVNNLLTQAQTTYQPFDYLLWFYDGQYTSNLIQAYTPSGSYGGRFNQLNELGGLGSQYVGVKKYENEIKDVLSRADNAEKYQVQVAIANILSVSLAINDADLTGSMPYSEAVKGRYGGTLTPKYDTQEELFTTWLTELDEDLTALGAQDQINPGRNDIVYGGNVDKWRKFANGLKLKIAVRLLHQNRAKAMEIAQQVGASDANIMGGLTDDYIFNRSEAAAEGGDADRGDYAYQTGNSVNMGAASKNVIDFMKKNEDPRMLVMFTKNSFNQEVIQSFFDAQANDTEGTVKSEVPQYILDNVEYTEDADGHKTFVAWKGQGEPWVRYYGIPIGLDISEQEQYTGADNYFVSTRWQVTEGENSKTYRPYSTFNEELVRGRCDFTFPTRPSGRTLQDTEDVPWWGMTMSTAEMNLYLAEFKTLGASLPKSAQEYFETALRASAEEYNKLATLNKIPYWNESQCFDGLGDAPIAYGKEMIDAMLAHEDYQLTGDKASDLEKIYIQMYLHFYYQPVDQFVTARRSGVPKVGSSLIPWVTMKASNEIPRRLYQVAPNVTNTMKDQMDKAFQEQGFTYSDGSDPSILSRERVWYDKNAPEFGAGPNY